MIDLKIRYLKAQDVLCFGGEGIEIHFDDYGNVVQIIGENLDVPPAEDGRPASNGAGKSSVQDLISLAFYGKTVKMPKKLKGEKIIHDHADQGTIELEWNDCRVERVFKRKGSNKLHLWEDKDHIWDKDTEISKGKGTTDTTDMIVQRVGLTHEAFCNVVVFDDSRDYDFLEADAKLKREIVENLLGLERYRAYGETAKNLLKSVKNKVDLLTKEYERLQLDMDACDRRITTVQQQENTWRSSKESEAKKLLMRYKNRQKELAATDVGVAMQKYEEAQEQIETLEIEQQKDEGQKGKIEEAISSAQSKVEEFKGVRDDINGVIQGHIGSLKAVEASAVEAAKSLQKLEQLEDGASCPVCHGEISKNNYGSALEHERNCLQGLRSQGEKLKGLIEQERQKLNQKNAVIDKANQAIGTSQSKLTTLSDRIRKRAQEITALRAISKPEGDSAVQVIEAEMTELKRQLAAMKSELEGDSPYKEILREAEDEKVSKKKECEAKSVEVSDAEEQIPYYDFWVKAFGDKGIRRLVVQGIIPALNSRIAYWLQCLIDGKLELTFDNQLEETVTRNGTPTNYANLSNGEKQRVNLAISQSFAHVMMLNSGTQPNLVFLDEVTGGGIDRAGTSMVHTMIFELAKERQVFVTTHNENLMQMLSGCESIVLRKKDDVSSIVS